MVSLGIYFLDFSQAERKETKDELLIGIILAAMTILAIGMILLHSNDPVYPKSRLSGSKNMIHKAVPILFNRF